MTGGKTVCMKRLSEMRRPTAAPWDPGGTNFDGIMIISGWPIPCANPRATVAISNGRNAASSGVTVIAASAVTTVAFNSRTSPIRRASAVTDAVPASPERPRLATITPISVPVSPISFM